MTTMTVGKTRFQLIENLVHMTSLRDEDGMVLSKAAEPVRKLQAFLAGRTVVNMMEIGIHRGGSAALFAELLNPRRLAAIDINPSAPMLDRWIEDQGRGEQVRAFYEVDQADASRLRQIHADFIGEPLDLVDDDASHELGRTRATFNALFPLMREGGAYIIEDWPWHEQTRDFPAVRPERWRDEPSLAGLVMEIMVAAARTPHLIEDILVNEAFVAVRKGSLAIGEDFDIRAFA